MATVLGALLVGSAGAAAQSPVRVESLTNLVEGEAADTPVSRKIAGFLGVGKPFQRETLFTWPGYQEPDEPEDPAEDRLKSDRPDFTEAASTVGRRRVQLETGYTFYSDKVVGLRIADSASTFPTDRSVGAQTVSHRTMTHTYPEALLRVGMLADWFEFRIAQNFLVQTTSGDGERTRDSGAADLYLGCKLYLTKQYRFFPETSLVLQGTVPTGAAAFTDRSGTYGANLLFNWDVLPDLISFGGSVQVNRVFDDVGTGYAQLSQSLTVGYTLTKKLNAYTEWFAFYPVGAVDTGAGARHYFDGGFQYFVTNNFALDIRAGVRLSRINSDDYFGGVGAVVRY